jgi:uncharacterized protein (TIGR02646 family)
MIYVERPPEAVPDILSSTRAEMALTELRRQHEDGSPLEFDSRIWLETRNDLHKLFHSKCAYCESRLGPVTAGDVDHFRPKLRAVDLAGNVSEGYWWLAYNWDNLYLSCPTCSARYKRNRFPVRGRRAEPFSDLGREDHILLDPCKRADFEEAHLVFTEDGQVSAATDRGKVTIEVLGLNRTELVTERGAEIEHTLKILAGSLAGLQELGIDGVLRAILPGGRRELAKRVKDLERTLLEVLSLERPYLGARRQILQARLERYYDILADLAPELCEELFRGFSRALSEERRDEVVDQYKKDKAQEQRYTIYGTDRQERAAYFGSVKRIEKVVIKNFKCLRDLTLDFPDPESFQVSLDSVVQQKLSGAEGLRESWLSLIGENATGKSTVLQAIALALMGEDERRRLGDIRPTDVLTHGQSVGYVEVFLSGLDESIRLGFSKETGRFESNARAPKVLILGYGATRLLRDADDPDDPDEDDGDEALVRIKNLFDPFAKLNNVERWMADTTTMPAKQFGIVRDALMDLLLLKQGQDRIYRRLGRLYANRNGQREPFKQLSDGYRAVTALALDIMLVLSRKWGGIRDAEGIVLIDELGVHLHPRWKMQIVDKLRRTFPLMQFVVATHEPLCLRGLGPGEVVLLKRDPNGRVVKVDELPSPADLRVDQLLTSEFFGLSSTIDPYVERLFNEYYALLAMDIRTPEQEERRKELQEELRDRKHLGDSPREELMYAVIDELLAKREVERPTVPMEELKQEAVDEVRQVWEEYLFE